MSPSNLKKERKKWGLPTEQTKKDKEKKNGRPELPISPKIPSHIHAFM